MPVLVGRFHSWQSLPGPLCGRWLPLYEIAKLCFEKGFSVDILADQFTDVRQAGYPWGGKAVYTRWDKTLAMTFGVAYGTDPILGTYRGDVHEFGHAVRFLLIPRLYSSVQGLKLQYLFTKAKQQGRLLDEYSSNNIEEFFAQSWEAFWTSKRDESGINWNRQDLKQKDPELYAWLAAWCRNRGAVVDLTVDGR